MQTVGGAVVMHSGPLRCMAAGVLGRKMLSCNCNYMTASLRSTPAALRSKPAHTLDRPSEAKPAADLAYESTADLMAKTAGLMR